MIIFCSFIGTQDDNYHLCRLLLVWYIKINYLIYLLIFKKIKYIIISINYNNFFKKKYSNSIKVQVESQDGGEWIKNSSSNFLWGVVDSPASQFNNIKQSNMLKLNEHEKFILIWCLVQSPWILRVSLRARANLVIKNV